MSTLARDIATAHNPLNTTTIEALRDQLMGWAFLAEAFGAAWSDPAADWSMSWAMSDYEEQSRAVCAMFVTSRPAADMPCERIQRYCAIIAQTVAIDGPRALFGGAL